MSGEAIFSRRLLLGWIVGAVVVFAISLYFMGGGELGGPDSVGPGTFSRSAIGHAGIADVLKQLGIPVVKSRSSSLDKLGAGSVLVIAEPRHTGASEEAVRTLLKAGTILLVLPKWTGLPSEQKPGWLREVIQGPTLRRAVGAGPGRAARRGGARKGRRPMDHQRAARHARSGLAGAARARRSPAPDHRRQPRHAGGRAQRQGPQDLGAGGPRHHRQSRHRPSGQRGPGAGPDQGAAQGRRQRRVRRDRARHRGAPGEPVPAAVPLPVRGGDGAGGARGRLAVVGERWGGSGRRRRHRRR